MRRGWIRSAVQKGLRVRNSPTCTLSQNGYGKYTRLAGEYKGIEHDVAVGFGTQKADSTQRSSQAVPHPSTNRALRRLTSEVRRDPVHSTRYGRQRTSWHLRKVSGCTALWQHYCKNAAFAKSVHSDGESEKVTAP